MASVLVGSDGNVTTATGYKAAINTWSASVSRATAQVTRFGDAGARRIASKVVDITGSAAGTPLYNASTTSAFGIVSSGAASQITLQWNDTGARLCSLQFSAVFNQVDFASAVDGDATVTFNFEIASSTSFSFSWDEVD